MDYISTRGAAPVLSFTDALITGLAEDSGLYLPRSYPEFSKAEIAAFAGQPYAAVAEAVVWPFVAGTLERAVLREMIASAYAGFDHVAVAPLSQLGDNLFLLELFHGPTLAFKDLAMQLLGRLMQHVLAARGQRATIIGATSGDTGAAAIAAFQGLPEVDVFILYPNGRVSDVQRRQMTTMAADNVHTIAIDGTFDDAQNMVKALFAAQTLSSGVFARRRQFDQLGARHGADRLLFHECRGARCAAPSRFLRRPDRQFRRYPRGLDREKNGAADRAARHRDQFQ